MATHHCTRQQTRANSLWCSIYVIRGQTRDDVISLEIDTMQHRAHASSRTFASLLIPLSF